MNESRTSVLRAQVTAKAVDLLRVPGVLAAESGYRIRGGKLTDEPVVSVIVERKLPPDELRPSEDLRALFGAQNVDVVEASPLQALFAQPERYGVDADTLKAIEDKVGWPFSAEAVVLDLFERPSRLPLAMLLGPPVSPTTFHTDLHQTAGWIRRQAAFACGATQARIAAGAN
jgi:hypothetical protein